MPLAPGTRLGPYEIVAPLGAGGMGEVWRARDARLGRDVAIKVLPERAASDPEALARFRREAQVVASLAHARRSREDPRLGLARRTVTGGDKTRWLDADERRLTGEDPGRDLRPVGAGEGAPAGERAW